MIARPPDENDDKRFHQPDPLHRMIWRRRNQLGRNLFGKHPTPWSAAIAALPAGFDGVVNRPAE
ncbi:hypothetical protein [Mycobacterium asiaticum]|uniref:Uncharacterized protein n=1 Tax=Mycobacterium asiaticum TaxID=1790 RepID=A0A1A3NSD5_MYCAS|nr:hypothetical protein [Mycobacterium asiaticum]OBK24285.1 hypothetical protein A5635_17895 [Mycobacterium asiaticum]